MSVDMLGTNSGQWGGGGGVEVVEEGNYNYRYTVTTRMTPERRGPVYIGPWRVQELCESRGGRPGISVLTRLTVSVDV